MIRECGGGLDLVARVLHAEGTDLVTRLKVLRTVFGLSLDEARAVDGS
ncbi:hypothetical protein [Saccharothrix sp. ALI-22-I]|nr:hypothetical protein [Saccharothrix sp. ALI-22-I]